MMNMSKRYILPVLWTICFMHSADAAEGTALTAVAPPTDFVLDNASIVENAEIGELVGIFSATDPEGGEAFVYTLTTTGGANDSALFQIQGNKLLSNAVFDFETTDTYEIEVTVTDAQDEVSVSTFTITVTDVDEPVNQPPTDIALDKATIAENQDAGTLVGILSTTDAEDGPDAEFMYELVDGEKDNSQFTIDEDQLLSNAVFDFETKADYEVLVRTTDSEGEPFEKVLPITVTDVDETPPNQPPTDIELTAKTVTEDAAIGTTVGILSTTDAEDDKDAEFVYELVAGEGDTDNEQFKIVNNELQSDATFDIEADETREVRIQTTDSGGETFEKTFTITITHVDEPAPNQPPTDITLSKLTIAENQPPLTLIGRLSTTDPDDTVFTYQKVGGEGSANHASFRIQGDSLLSEEEFDFETKASYQVRIRTTDAQDASFEESFTITVTDVNETVNQAPTDIRLDKETIAENQPEGSLVGDLFTTDLDNNSGFVYTLTAGEGDTDNASFRIRDNQLLTAASFDFETQSRYQVRITTTDPEGATFAKAFTIRITDLNENTNQAPTDLLLDNNTIAENEPLGTEVGRFTVVDQDAGDRHTVTLVEGEGDDDNGRFQLRDNTLYSLVSFDFEDRSTYSIRVQGQDSQQATVTNVFTIVVTNVDDDENQPPTDIRLSNTEVNEGQIVNLVVGTFTADDPNPEDTPTFALVAGEGDDDNAIFSIADHQLQTAQTFDFDTQPRYRIRVRADDGRGGTLEKSLTLMVIKGQNNAPTLANPVDDLSAEVGEPFSFTLPDATFEDADATDVLTYAVTLAEGQPLPDWLAFAATSRILSGTPPSDSPDLLALEVTASDGRGASASAPFILTITRITAVEDELSAAWTVYPVPTDRRLLTVTTPPGFGPVVQLRLLDTRGRLVHLFRINARSAEHTLLLPEALGTGTYFLEVRTAEHMTRKRILLR